MKKLILLLLLIFNVGAACAQQVEQAPASSGISKKENDKKFLADYFQQTYAALERDVSGLSQEQLQYKPAADRWSISQCLEHIVLTERMLFDEAKKNLQAPASPKRRSDVKISDEEVIKAITDRSHKVKAPDALIKDGKYTDPKQALTELQNDRKQVLAYLDKRPLDDLRNHISDTPFGASDGYHSFLYIAGHTARHTLQIEEVKADPGFPK